MVAPWMAAVSFGLDGYDDYNGRTGKRRGGIGSGAHGDHAGKVSELGEAWMAVNRRWGCRWPEVEDELEDDAAGLPEGRGSVGRKKRSRPSS